MQGYVRKPIRVYLVDDHDIVRRGLRDLMAVKRDITVVGDSGSAQDAVPRILELMPDVMVLDLQLQDGSGINVCRAVRSVAPTVRGLFVTSASDDDAVVATLLAGASGYATKLVNSMTLLDDVRRVGSGRPVLDAGAAENAKRRLVDDAESGALTLDERQVEVLGHVLAGRTDGEIAGVMGISADEVRQAVGVIVREVTRP